MIGVTLAIDEYRRLQTCSQPNKLTLALAEKLYGVEQLTKATVTEKDLNQQRDPKVMLAIKNEVLKVFGSTLSSEDKAKLWHTCTASIAGKCKNLRYARKKGLEYAATVDNSNVST